MQLHSARWKHGSPAHAGIDLEKTLGPPTIAEGSPAHAGIDPSPPAQARVDPRFPRPRGDRPPVIRLGHIGVGVPPPTRASSGVRNRR